jgi:hypothetical protein
MPPGWFFRILLSAPVPIWLFLGIVVLLWIRDHWRAKRLTQLRMRVLEEEISWEIDPEDPQQESLGEMSRARLPREHQIVVTRVAELLQGML